MSSLSLTPVTAGALSNLPSTPPWSWFLATDYGAVPNSGINERAHIQAAIDACITAGGGVVYLPAGDYRVNTALDFSAINSANKGVMLKGAGCGGGTTGYTGASRLLNYNTGPAIQAQGLTVNSFVTGLWLEDFSVHNTVALGAGKYTIYWDGVAGYSGMRRVNVYGRPTATANCGNGIAILNCFNSGGGLVLDTCTAWNFLDTTTGKGEGFRIGGQTGTTFASGAGASSGAVTAISCIGWNCGNAWRIGVSGAGLSNCNFISCGAAGTGTTPAQRGWYLDGAQGCSFIGCSSEDYPGVGFYLVNAKGNTILSPVLDGQAGGSSAGISFTSTSINNTVLNARVGGFDYGVGADSGSVGNFVSLFANTDRALGVRLVSDSDSGNYYWDTGHAYIRIDGVMSEGVVASSDVGAAANKKLVVRNSDGTVAGYIRLYAS